MEFTIAGRHFDITDSIYEYTEKKTAKLHRFYDRIQAIHVVVSQPDHREFDIEVIISIVKHDPVVAHNTGDDLYACIDKVIDKCERQLTDLKEKRKNHKFSEQPDYDQKTE